ncbi:related to Protein phosphatase methylesterase 1 [Melanopsichium pennsylvanicum]|uniref:Protein phosphatase methylesterase 1 n=2 Tax=Melanopsichium pennsylvanicum TaxID=63383 RepID=A0AAJ4XGK5_9BASI|nr:related to protein phosphatase methylesterase 1 [Melanopsichium pennsylvanicum 4]SNX81326.1 related to Protein phosphatase methylesterase 1 [Melanopsichium pennsylvanicum]
MSDLQRSFLKGKLSKLPPVPPFSEADDEELAELESRDSFAISSSSPSSSSSTSIPRLMKRRPHADDYSPRSAEGYFEQALVVDVPLSIGSASFRVYYTPPRPKQAASHVAELVSPKPEAAATSLQDLHLEVGSGTLPTLRHGVGLSSEEGDDDDEAAPSNTSSQTATRNPGSLLVMHHGAGFSALSYALAAAQITKMTNSELGVLAYDCRGHGRTKLDSVPTDPIDMSIDTLSSDLVCLLSTMFPERESMPSLVLVGHSMGGSVVVSAAHAFSVEGFNRICGVAVLDVVEGTAMDALSVMRSVVLSHPLSFASVEDAIKWHVDSKTISNLDSARISVPPLLEPNPAFSYSAFSHSNMDDQEPQEVLDDSPVDANQSEARSKSAQNAYIWKANLLATESYWRSWFEGLSSRFLGVKTARLLLLAGTDRLDRELMIGQMQGKYQLEVIADVGHSLHEDAPDRTAKILIDFWRRNERIINLPVKVKKVGDA